MDVLLLVFFNDYFDQGCVKCKPFQSDWLGGGVERWFMDPASIICFFWPWVWWGRFKMQWRRPLQPCHRPDHYFICSPRFFFFSASEWNPRSLRGNPSQCTEWDQHLATDPASLHRCFPMGVLLQKWFVSSSILLFAVPLEIKPIVDHPNVKIFPLFIGHRSEPKFECLSSLWKLPPVVSWLPFALIWLCFFSGRVSSRPPFLLSLSLLCRKSAYPVFRRFFCNQLPGRGR